MARNKENEGFRGETTPHPEPQTPQAIITLPRELRLVQVGDADLREVLDGARRHVVRARSARRRLFVDDDDPAEEEGGAGGSGEVSPRRRRTEEPLDAVDKMAAEETAAAARRWNFDFENERPLEGQWQWEKVGDLGDSEGDENGDPRPQKEEGADGCHSPQR